MTAVADDFDPDAFLATWEAPDRIESANHKLCHMLPDIRNKIQAATLEARQRLFQVRCEHEDEIETHQRLRRWRQTE